MAASSLGMPSLSSSSTWTLTMSAMVMMGKLVPKRAPVAGSVLAGPVVPPQPPSTLAQITK